MNLKGNINCTNIKNSKIQSTDNFISYIPKIIHRIWMIFDTANPEMLERYKEADRILKCLHPDWFFFEWDDKKVLNFIFNNYSDFFKQYILYSDPIMRYELASYLILKHFGGVLTEQNFIFQKNIAPLLGEKELIFFGKSDELNKGFIASVPQHKFWDFVIINLKHVFFDHLFKKNQSIFLTDSLKEYQKINNDKSIFVLPNKYLMPFDDIEKEEPEIKNNCVNNQNLTKCFDIFPDAYAYTNWASSWTKLNESTKAKVNLSDLSLAEKPLYHKLYIMNLKRSPDRWAKRAYDFFINDIPFEIFKAVDGYYDVTIHNVTSNYLIVNNIPAKGIDLKRKLYKLGFQDFYHITCDNGLQPPLNISLKAKASVLMAGNIAVTCTKALIREEIKKNNFANTVILEDDFELNFNNFTYYFNEFIQNLPEDYDIAYLHNWIAHRDKLKQENNAAFSLRNSDKWFGDWAHMLSLNGAIKLNLGYKFIGNSDEYTRELASGVIKKEGVESFKAYAAIHNFSLSHSNQYRGKNKNSISTKMGCRTFHNSEASDCDDKMHIDQTYVARVNEFKPEILQNKKVICNSNSIHPVEISYKSHTINFTNSIINDVALWCGHYKIWQNAKRRHYNNILVFNNNIDIQNNFAQAFDKALNSLPKFFDVALLFYNLSNGDYKNFANLYSGRGVDKLLNQEFFNTSISSYLMSLESIKDVIPFPTSSPTKAEGLKIGDPLWIPAFAGMTSVRSGQLAMGNGISYNYQINKIIFDYNAAQILSSNNSILEKPAIHTANNITKFINQIYVINLPEATERREYISAHLTSHGLDYIIWNATNGYKIKIVDDNSTFTGKDLKFGFKTIAPYKLYEIYCNPNVHFTFRGYLNWMNRTISAGELGVFCSNYRIWLDAIKNNHNKIMVVEDDAILVDDFKNKLIDFINNIPENFDIAFLYYSTNEKNTLLKINDYAYSLKYNIGWECAAVVYNLAAIKKLLQLPFYTLALDKFYSFLSSGRSNEQVLNHHELEKFAGTFNNYASLTNLVVVKDFTDDLSISNMGRYKTGLTKKMPELDHIYVSISEEDISSWDKILSEFSHANILVSKFEAINTKNIQIEEIFASNTLGSMSHNLEEDKLYKVSCKFTNSEKEFLFKVYFTENSDDIYKLQISEWCNYINVWNDAIDSEYEQIMVIDNKLLPKASTRNDLIKFMIDLPKDKHIAFPSINTHDAIIFNVSVLPELLAKNYYSSNPSKFLITFPTSSPGEGQRPLRPEDPLLIPASAGMTSVRSGQLAMENGIRCGSEEEYTEECNVLADNYKIYYNDIELF